MSSSSSLFTGVQVAPPIEVFHKNKLYIDETDPRKVNLTIGAYRTEEGLPWVLPVVHLAEQQLVEDGSINHEYLPVLGLENFTIAARNLVLGADSPAVKENRAFGVQCLSGTGSLRVGAEFLSRVIGLDTAYISSPTWGNHTLVFKNAGFKTVNKYRYWDAANRRIDIEGLLEDLRNAPPRSVIILHGCAHNPTGMDPNHEQWTRIAQVIKEKNLFTFFDIAYQGFASGNPDEDAFAIRLFVEQGVEMFVAQSFAKNFGLYNERVGNLTVVVKDPSVIQGLKSQIQLVIRANWSNPPAHGARIVSRVLERPELRQQWDDSIHIMSARIREMRSVLRNLLETLGTPGCWAHITQQIGMFSYTGLSKAQVDYLIHTHKIFLLDDGRINVCGLNHKNVEYVAKGIDDAVRNIQPKL